MKGNAVAIVVALLGALAIVGVGAQEARNVGERILPGGLTLSGDLGASTLDDEPVGLIGLRVTTSAGRWLDVGLSFGAVHTLERDYDDLAGREYQAEFGYASIVVRPRLSLGEVVEIGLPVSSGVGILQYRFERRYREELTWTEEFLDREPVHVYTAGIDIRVALSERFGARVEGGYRAATGLDSPLAERDTANGPYTIAGVVFRPW